MYFFFILDINDGWCDGLILSCFGSYFRFMKFNNRFLRRILIRDNRAESSIVALYKKLELQNAMEILDTVSGDFSAAPSIVSLQYETWILSHTAASSVQINRRGNNLFFNTSFDVREKKKGSAKPKKKFLAEDLRNMHNMLSKNMYKIRQRVR